ncbi:MAG: tRNA lysidine(34) synthetase TilS [Acidobacteria bacterium]|nr:tRNA lysidine(34) synthetase TilS [Acidobacteriota bacterium]
MPDLLRRVHSYAGRHGLWTPDTRVVAAVSGGSDSVALLLILHLLSREGCLRLVGAAHLHHHIRAGDADADAAFVQGLAARLGVPCKVGHADVRALARGGRRSLEVAGRQARLAFYAQARSSMAADRVALAHTRGDQAETVLLRLARGAGARGLAGMAPLNGHRVRPLLELGRDQLRSFLRARGETWRDDASNADVSVLRNRLRHEVLPALAAANPRVEEALARAARILAADSVWLDELARAETRRLVAWHQGRASVDLAELARLPEALARRIVLGTLETLDASRAYGWADTDAVLHGTSVGTDLGRIRLERNREFAVLFKRAPLEVAPAAAPDEGPWALPVPGVARHPAGRWQLEATGPMAPADAPAASAQCAVLDAGALGRHLSIRGWRAGDRVQPLGMRGRKKLQDVFVDRKVPHDRRAFVPLVLDGRARIAWVAGHVVGEAFRVTSSSSAVVILTLRQ